MAVPFTAEGREGCGNGERAAGVALGRQFMAGSDKRQNYGKNQDSAISHTFFHVHFFFSPFSLSLFLRKRRGE